MRTPHRWPEAHRRHGSDWSLCPSLGRGRDHPHAPATINRSLNPSSKHHALAQRLFGINGVTGVFLGSDFISVTKGEAEWQHLKPAILGAIMEHYLSGAPIVDLLTVVRGSIFSAGATMQWLRDGLKLIRNSAESEAIARGLEGNGGVYLVPAFAGLGAPQWNADARGTIVGLTRDSRLEHLVRAGLEAVAYQTADLLDALRADGAPRIESLLVDGGLTASMPYAGKPV